jgi:ribosomal protein S20
MFSKIVHNRVAGIALAGALAAGVLGAGGVAMAEGGSGTSPTVATSSVSATTAKHPRAKAVLELRKDIIAKSGLTKADFKAGRAAHKSINDILGANAATVKAQVLTDAQAKITAAASNGTITQAQADKLNAKLPTLLDKVFAHVPDGSHAGRIKAIGKEALRTAANVSGIDVKGLRTVLKNGQSIAQVASDKTPAVITALDAKADSAIDTAVTNGKVKAENADALKAKAHERVTEFVNKTR